MDTPSRRRILIGELRRGALWFIWLRWWVAPAIGFGVMVANWFGFEYYQLGVVAVAVLILFYNTVLQVVRGRILAKADVPAGRIRHFSYWQVGLDYAAIFLLIHFTGGAASPFIFFFIFHIIFAAILLPASWAYAFATLSSVGLSLLATAEYYGLIGQHPIIHAGHAIDLTAHPDHMFVEILFFSASVFIASFLTSTIATMLRSRVLALDRSATAIKELNERQFALYCMIQAIGTEQRLSHVLEQVCENLTQVMEIRALSVKLLNGDRKHLRYAASCGLPNSLAEKASIELDKSPLNLRVIKGEPFVTGDVSQREMFQFGEDLESAGLRSVLFVPLRADGKVIGILGGYSRKVDRFGRDDLAIFQQAADLVAIFIENALAYERIEGLVRERTRFMTKVAHNLRAPLDAAISILNVVRDGYMGDLQDQQSEYLRRVHRRAMTMRAMINELMALARSRAGAIALEQKPVSIQAIASRLRETFQEDAIRKALQFEVLAPEAALEIIGDRDMLEQVLENLVSNAIKYTERGEVEVEFGLTGDQGLRIVVRDTGIGIPAKDQAQLYSDFFRAENARAIEEIGTGLGLAIVREAVDQMGGTIRLDSDEGRGTTFTLTLPLGELERDHDGVDGADLA